MKLRKFSTWISDTEKEMKEGVERKEIDMADIITLTAERKNHKPLKIDFFNTPFGRIAAQREKENLERRGYSVILK